jgi:GntR family transcriptional regulator
MLMPSDAADRFTPIYFRIQESVRERIVSGAVRPGERLPSEPELARTFSTSRLTVRHALARLEYDGMIERRPGRGTFVAQPNAVVSQVNTMKTHSFEEQVALGGKAVTYRVLAWRAVAAPARVAERLAIEEGARIYRLDRLRVVDGRTVGLEVRHVPEASGRQITRDMVERLSAYDFMSAVLGERIPAIEVSLTAETAGKRTAALLGVKPGSAIMIRDHVFRNSAGRVVQHGLSSFPGDIRMNYVLGGVPPRGKD